MAAAARSFLLHKKELLIKPYDSESESGPKACNQFMHECFSYKKPFYSRNVKMLICKFIVATIQTEMFLMTEIQHVMRQESLSVLIICCKKDSKKRLDNLANSAPIVYA